MNLEYLNTFLSVAKVGSFSGASRKIYLSQPAISFQIRKLEQELGVPLVDRRKKTISITAAGKRVLRFAENVAHERANLVRDLEQLREEVVGELIIIASPISGEFILPPILSEFKENFPAAGFEVTISDSFTTITQVKNGAYDAGFCSIQPEKADLESFKMAEDELVLFVYPGHPFSNRKEISLGELAGEPLILREEPVEKRPTDAALLLQAGFDINKCKPRMTLGTNMGVVSAVESRAGIAFLPYLAVKKSEALGLVKIVKIADLTLKREFFCVYRKEKIISRLLKEFISFAKARAFSEA